MKATRGIDGKVTVTGHPVDLPAEMQHNLLRICQEAMSNASRHAHPPVWMSNSRIPTAALTAAIRDDGCGIRKWKILLSENAGISGLTVWRNAARRIGGKLNVQSRSAGNRDRALIPIEQKQDL